MMRAVDSAISRVVERVNNSYGSEGSNSEHTSPNFIESSSTVNQNVIDASTAVDIAATWATERYGGCNRNKNSNVSEGKSY